MEKLGGDSVSLAQVLWALGFLACLELEACKKRPVTQCMPGSTGLTGFDESRRQFLIFKANAIKSTFIVIRQSLHFLRPNT